MKTLIKMKAIILFIKVVRSIKRSELAILMVNTIMIIAVILYLSLIAFAVFYST